MMEKKKRRGKTKRGKDKGGYCEEKAGEDGATGADKDKIKGKMKIGIPKKIRERETVEMKDKCWVD